MTLKPATFSLGSSRTAVHHLRAALPSCKAADDPAYRADYNIDDERLG